MDRRVTHELGDEFEERTLFFWAALGVVALLRRVGRAAVEPARRATITLMDEPPPVERHEALYALLGVLAVARTARVHWRVLATDRADPPTAAQRKVGRPVARPRSLLL
jgi:hypothetical protein